MNRHFFFQIKDYFLTVAFLIFSFLLVKVSFAQPGHEKGLPFITNYSAGESGSRGTWSVIQGNDGRMYFGSSTNKGNIVEYDGVNWNKIAAPYSSAVARCFAKDNNGRIYFGGSGDFGYLDKDELGETVEHSLLQFVPKDKREFFDVWSVNTAGNEVFFLSRERIFRLTKTGEGKNETWKVKTWEPQTHFMYSFYGDNNLYVHEQNVGLLKMESDSLVLIPGSEFLGNDRMQVMLPYDGSENSTNNKKYLLATFTHGLYLFDGKNFTPFKTSDDKIFTGNMVYKGLFVNGKYLFSVLGTGLVIMDHSGKVEQIINRDAGLKSNIIYAPYIDSRGQLWLGLDVGISRLDYNSPFSLYNSQNGVGASLLSMMRAPDGNLYAGTQNGLLHYNVSVNRFEQVNEIPKNQVFALLVDGKNLLVGAGGLFLIKDGKIITVQPSVTNNLNVSSLALSMKYPNLLYTGTSFGIAIFQRNPGSERGWDYLGYLTGIKGGEFHNMVEDSEGNLWAISRNNILYKITPSFNAAGHPDISKFNIVDISTSTNGYDSTINSLFALNQRIYFSSDSSTYTFNSKNNRFEKTLFEGFKHYVATQDTTTGKIWLREIAADSSKSIIATPKPGGGYQIDSTSLLPISSETSGAVYPDIDQTAWFNSTDGIIHFDEKQKVNYDAPYKTIISKISSDTFRLNPTASSATPAEIKFNRSSLRFEYASPFYEQENKTQYQTWMEGFEKTWSKWGPNTYKEYTNLPAGKYVFHVRAKNVYDKISNEATYSFTILPPWYSTWWAYLLYALVFLLVGFLILKWRTRKLEEKHRELEKTIKERTAELSNKVEELAVINSVQQGLVAQLDINKIYELVGEKIREIFNAQTIVIATYDLKSNNIIEKYCYEKGDRTLMEPYQAIGFGKHVIENRQPILLNKNVVEEGKKYGSVTMGGEPAKSLVFVPMIENDQATGLITLQNMDQENAFSESDVNLLKTLANSMSVALKSALLFDETIRLLKETEQRNAELAVINSVQEGLVAQMTMEDIYTLVGNKIRDLFDAQTVVIRSYNYETEEEVYNYTIEKGERQSIVERPFDDFTRHILETKKPVIVNENFLDFISKFSDEAHLVGEVPKSAVFVPMIHGGVVTGNVSLQNMDHENAFSESDVNLLSTLGNSMSIALKSAHLFDETTRLLKETEQRTAELSVINSVQEGLAKELHMQGIYELVGDKLSEVLHTLDIDIRLFSPEINEVSYPYVRDHGKRINVPPSKFLGMSKKVYETRQHIIINEDLPGKMKEFGSVLLPGTQMEKSFMAVPIMVSNNPIGMVSMSNYEKENAFSDSDLRLLQTVVSAMSVALENARLFDETTRLLKETEQRTAELGVINSVQEGLVKEMNIEAIYELVGKRLCDLFPDSQTLVIRTFDHSKGLENWQYAIEKGVRLHSEPRPVNWINKELIVSKKPILINENFLETAKNKGGINVTIGEAPKSVIFVPMVVGDVVKGSVSLQNVDTENAFTESDLRLLTTLTNSMSVALENARLFDETNHLLAQAKQRASELSTVNNISKALASKLNPSDLIQQVGDQLRDLFNANIVYLALLNKKTNIIHFPYQYGDNMPSMKLGEGLTSNIILKGDPLLFNKDVDEKTDQLGLNRVGIPAASYLGVPIPVADEIIGVLSVQSTEQENRFDENDLRLLSTIASSVGVALRNAQLFEEVEQAKMEAEKATKIAEKANEAKSAFLSTVSHELRTPLTSVLGFAKIISKRLHDKIFPIVDQSDPKTEKTVNQINENLNVVISEGERLTHLINDVLDLAKIEAGRMEWNQENVSLGEVVERAISATTSLFEQKNIKLVKKIDENVPDIIGDTDKLIQVVINLFSNAVKFTEKGDVTCKVYQKGNEVIVSVKDTGIGIASEDYGAVFEQFKQVGGDTLTDKPKGTGLGLPICKEIVEHHGGRIWVDSQVGKGSTFSFAIPFVPSENNSHQKPIHLNDLVRQLKEQMVFPELKPNGGNSTILVVDDDDSIRSLLEQELSEAGYLIEQATNGKQALECIRKNRPDLIILDVMMPEMNGFDVAAILKNDPQTMDIPIIILSIVQDKARGFRIGVDRYLTKPIDTAQLFTEVGNLLEQGKSKKKVMVVDEDAAAVRSLTEVLQAKGYQVVESDGKELAEQAIATKPDIIILNSVYSGKQEIVKTLRFEKGLENVLFFIYQ
ncbi:MAG: GAF domain-containing protein [Bacteroidota bacterium]|nr:GAF domain-containing protein [Bacteroidota bacterium]